VPPVVRSHKLAHASLAPTGASDGRSGIKFAAEAEAAWDDEHDVWKLARRSSGVTQLGLLSSLLVAVTAAVAQSYGSGKLKPVQFLFNTCTLMNACGLAYLAYHSRLFAAHGGPAVSLAVAASAYFLANTAPVAGIIGLTEGNSPFALWHKIFLWSFPNYVIGAGLAAIASFFVTITGMAGLVAVLFGVYKSYKMYVGLTEHAHPKAFAMAASH
jgi:hypothetical protein